MLKYLWIMYFLPHGFSWSYFCNLKCGRHANTACTREPCLLSVHCGSNSKMLPLDDESRQWILDAHNERRNNLALGRDTTGGNGKAANMRALSYSKEIEFVAQCHSNSCKDKGVHDKCRRTSKFSYVGQNMFAVGGTGSYDFKEKHWLVNAASAWYNEINNMDGYVVDKFQPNGKVVGHFTQLVWAKTTHIGCARTQYGSGKANYVLIYCNYGAGGNILGVPVYVRGEPCSKCGPEACNSKYPGLCGKISPMSEDSWKSPFKLLGSRLQCSFLQVVIFVLVAVMLL